MRVDTAIVTRELPQRHDLLVPVALQPQRYPCLLQSVAIGDRAAWDVVPAFPQDSLRLDRTGGVVDAQGCAAGNDFLAALDAQWRAQPAAPGAAAAALPFRGGWALFLSYEIATSIEPVLQLPDAPDAVLPRAIALRCPVGVFVDHRRGRTMLVAELAHAHLLDVVERDLAQARAPQPAALSLSAIEEDAPQDFLDGVARIHEYLRAGDIFQVNLLRERRVRLARAASPAQFYANLRPANPSPFAGLFQFDDRAVTSSSPERLVQVQATSCRRDRLPAHGRAFPETAMQRVSANWADIPRSVPGTSCSSTWNAMTWAVSRDPAASSSTSS